MSAMVSIVIVCMNRLDNLYPCLESIHAHCRSVSYETFVVAYRFSEENFARVQTDFPWVQFIESREIRGFSENNNLALRKVRSPYVFVLNDDTLMQSDVIARLIKDFDYLPKDAAIVSPRLLNSDGTLQLCGRPPYPAYHYAFQQWHLYREPIDDTIGKVAEFEEVFRTSNISGAAFLIKTAFFSELGWFDEKYFFTPEDIALSTLARKRGYGVYVDRAASIVHKWRSTATASTMSIAIRPASVRGSLMFFSGGSNIAYLLLATPVWFAEFFKYLKASLLLSIRPSDRLNIQKLTYRAITKAIFTHKRPKELFLENYERLSGESVGAPNKK